MDVDLSYMDNKPQEQEVNGTEESHDFGSLYMLHISTLAYLAHLCAQSCPTTQASMAVDAGILIFFDKVSVTCENEYF